MKKKFMGETFDYFKAILFAIVMAIILKSAIAEAYLVPSSSMEDTLLVGDLIISNKIIYGARIPYTEYRLPAIRQPQQGDIITFKFPLDRKTDYVKRCVATEGQKVEVIDKVLYVDGEIFPDPAHSKYLDKNILSELRAPRDNYGPFIVPKGSIFAMGDNRDRSSDSRYWGPVPIELIDGNVFMIPWSIAEDTTATEMELSDLTTFPKSVWDTATHFFGRVRWDRFVTSVD